MTAVTLLTPALAGCSFLGIGGNGTSGESVFSVKVGQCFLSPTAVKTQLSKVEQVDCSKPHGSEAYALPRYPAGDNANYPGDSKIQKYAEAACASAFQAYVGVNYLDSSLYDTYLAPSPRSWQDDDRTVICLITDAGKQMTGSMKGSKL
jgi:hypothetical protein